MMNRKKRKNKLDERQEQQLLQIEHNGFWLAFWGLAIAYIVQVFIYGAEQQEVFTGEFVIFLCIALYMVVSCIRYGIWDRKIAPSPKTNLFCSGIAGIISAIFYFVDSYHDYHAFWGAVATGVYMLFFVAVVCFVALSFATFLYRRRVDVLENEEEKTGVDEHERK